MIEVSIIIPCRNEEKFIGKCLESIIKQDYPKEKMEVLVVDGMSEDKTRERIEEFKIKNLKLKIKILDNPNKFTPFGLNIGVKNAKGEIIIRMDAHATYEKNYISKCVKYLNEYNADNVGGVMKTLPRENTLFGRAVALALSSSFGVGKSTFRKGSKKPKWVDTVFGGCYKREVFDKIGLFNENLLKGQDMEFNLRLKKAGGKILLHPEIVSYYYARSKLNLSFCRFYFGEGFWAVYPAKFVGKSFIFLWRLIPFAFVSSLIITAILSFFSPFFKWLFIFIVSFYFLANLYFSFLIAIKEKDFRYFFVLPLIFALIHISYGFGSIYGFFKLLFPKTK
ncbi:MAG: glycosyltransferase family 2 protein [Minisyncoccales bacterium]